MSLGFLMSLHFWHIWHSIYTCCRDRSAFSIVAILSYVGVLLDLIGGGVDFRFYGVGL